MHTRLIPERAAADQFGITTRSLNSGEGSDEQKHRVFVARTRMQALEVAIARLADTMLLLRNL